MGRARILDSKSRWWSPVLWWEAYCDFTDIIGFGKFEDKRINLTYDFFGFHVLGAIAVGLIWYFVF